MKATILLLAMITVSSYAFSAGMGLGVTVMTEAQSDADYGWTGTLSSGAEFLGIDWGARLMGTIYYPEHGAVDHAAITGTVLGTGLVNLDSECAIELGGGIQYGNEYARTIDEASYLPVFYYGMDFSLASGHHIKPFTMITIGAERKTVQAGFLFTFWR